MKRDSHGWYPGGEPSDDGFVMIGGVVGHVLLVIFAILLIVNYTRILANVGGFTFSSLLESINSYENFTLVNTIPSIPLNDWGVFNFLRDFVNGLINIFNSLLWIFGNIVNTLKFLLHICRSVLFI